MHDTFHAHHHGCQSEERIAEQIARQIEANVDYFSQRPGEIERRLAELDAEWDVERATRLCVGTVGLAGLGLGLFWRRFLLLPGAVLCCLARHALTGQSPPETVLRRLGLRTRQEIDRERLALEPLQPGAGGSGGEQPPP